MKSYFKFLIILTFLAYSCQKILFNEEEGTREILLENFHAIKFSGIYDVVLEQDSINKLVITGGNDIHSIEAVIEGDTLVIDDHKKRSLNPARNLLVLHFSYLEYMHFSDPVNLSNTDTLKSDRLVLIAEGEIAEVRLVLDCNYFTALNNSNTLGYFHFTGKAGSCWLWNRYGSCMYANSLMCNDAVVYNESIGDVYINASENLQAFIKSSGNIFYYGSPVIKISEKRGAGNIIPM